jgi:hypothetical protein
MAQPKIIELSGRIDNITSSAVEATLDCGKFSCASCLGLDGNFHLTVRPTALESAAARP